MLKQRNIHADLPAKLISLLGCIICPLSGRKTKGICCDVDPDTNGDKTHSAKERIGNYSACYVMHELLVTNNFQFL